MIFPKNTIRISNSFNIETIALKSTLLKVFYYVFPNPLGALKLFCMYLFVSFYQPISYNFAICISRSNRLIRELLILLYLPILFIIYGINKNKLLRSQGDDSFISQQFYRGKNESQIHGIEVFLGEFDKFGKFVDFERIPHEFIARSRSRINLLSIGDAKFIRKTFLGTNGWFRMINEIRAIIFLNKKNVEVPIILDYSLFKKQIEIQYVGQSLHNLLIEKNAQVNQVDTYFTDGIRTLQAHYSQLLGPISYKLKQIHRAGVNLYDINYANILVSDDITKVFFIDFESARIYRKTKSATFLVQRDRDSKKLMNLLGTIELTYDSVKSQLAEVIKSKQLYAPYSIGFGLNTPGLLDRNLGFGKYYYILHSQVKNFLNKSVLSLGTNNCSVELIMSRTKGCKIKCIEINEENVIQAEFFLKASEWADNSKIDLEILVGNIAEKLPLKSRFDLTMALCSIYYLGEKNMLKTLNSIKKITSFILLQANNATGIGRENLQSYKIASLEWQVKALSGLGFNVVKVKNWKQYSRPTILASSTVE